MKLAPQDRAILAALELYACAGDVAAETGAPLKRVVYLQRLYGPTHCQIQRRDEDRETSAHAAERTGFRPRRDMFLAVAPSPVYAPYWLQWQAAHPEEPMAMPVPVPRPRALPEPPPDLIPVTVDPAKPIHLAPVFRQPARAARMVPDDRRDEGIDFEAIMVSAVETERQRGRGAA